MRASTLYPCAIFAVCLLVTPLQLAAQEPDFEWRGRVDRGDELEVQVVSGNILARRASGGDVEVVAHKYGRDADDVDIEVAQDGQGVTICVVYPGRRSGRTPCEFGGWNGGHIDDIDASVDFDIRVPEGVHLIARSVSGNIDGEDLASLVRASTVSGDVDVSTTDIVEATTVSGSIRVRMGRTNWTGDLRFKTVSGDITLSLPSDVHAEVDFESLSGDMHSDFEITTSRMRGRWVGREIRGVIGRGGRSLSASTVSGDLRLRRH